MPHESALRGYPVVVVSASLSPTLVNQFWGLFLMAGLKEGFFLAFHSVFLDLMPSIVSFACMQRWFPKHWKQTLLSFLTFSDNCKSKNERIYINQRRMDFHLVNLICCKQPFCHHYCKVFIYSWVHKADWGHRKLLRSWNLQWEETPGNLPWRVKW